MGLPLMEAQDAAHINSIPIGGTASHGVRIPRSLGHRRFVCQHRFIFSSTFCLDTSRKSKLNTAYESSRPEGIAYCIASRLRLRPATAAIPSPKTKSAEPAPPTPLRATPQQPPGSVGSSPPPAPLPPLPALPPEPPPPPAPFIPHTPPLQAFPFTQCSANVQSVLHPVPSSQA